jgi:hypothetical protein
VSRRPLNPSPTILDLKEDQPRKFIVSRWAGVPRKKRRRLRAFLRNPPQLARLIHRGCKCLSSELEDSPSVGPGSNVAARRVTIRLMIPREERRTSSVDDDLAIPKFY